MRDGEFAVRVSELFHAEHAREQNAVAVFDNATGPCIERTSGEGGVHPVRAHVGDNIAQVVCNPVGLV